MDIPALEAAVRGLEHSIGVFTWCLLGSTFVVSLGLILEYWHPVSEFIDELKWPMSVFRWPTFMEIAGGILVTIGVLGEFGFTLEVFVLEGRLEQANHAIRDTLTAKLGEADKMAKTAVSDSSIAFSQAKDALSKAGKAEASLGKAETEAKNAQTASSSALTMAAQARKEADSFETDIKSAKKQAADAESHLAAALKAAAAAQVELNLLKTPRSLTNVLALISALRPFEGVEYAFSGVFGDEESMELADQISDALQQAGWKATFAPNTGTGSSWIRLKHFPTGVNLDVGTGVRIGAEATEKPEDLNALPQSKRPQQVQAASALALALAHSIFPTQNDLATSVLSVIPPSDRFRPPRFDAVLINVGKKP
jgi:hypothetical protein